MRWNLGGTEWVKRATVKGVWGLPPRKKKKIPIYCSRYANCYSLRICTRAFGPRPFVVGMGKVSSIIERIYIRPCKVIYLFIIPARPILSPAPTIFKNFNSYIVAKYILWWAFRNDPIIHLTSWIYSVCNLIAWLSNAMIDFNYLLVYWRTQEVYYTCFM